MPAGRPQKADAGTLYTFAHQLYWDLRRLAEGSQRWKFDKKEYDRLAAGADNLRLTDEQESALQKYLKEEVEAGRLEETEKDARLQNLRESNLSVTREWYLGEAAGAATKQIKIPGEPDVLRDLLQVTSVDHIHAICEDAFVPREIEVEPGRTKSVKMHNWPISIGSVLPMYLSQHAAEFIAAKNDSRFPQSGRPTSQLKQLWFLARALAGAIFGIKARTAINLVGSKRPEEIFEESRAGKPLRQTRKRHGA